MPLLTYSQLITRRQLSALSGGKIENRRYPNPLGLGTPFSFNGGKAIATKNRTIHHICLKEAKNRPLPESTDQKFVTCRYAVGAKKTTVVEADCHDNEQDEPQVQSDVQLLLDLGGKHGPIPIFWEPEYQPPREGGKGVAYVGHWSVTGVKKMKFFYKGKERCAKIYFRFARYDKGFASIITQAHNKNCNQIYKLFGERQVEDSPDDENEDVDKNDNIDTEAEGRTLRPRDMSSRYNNEFASHDDDDDDDDVEVEEEEDNVDEDENYEADDEYRAVQAVDPRLPVYGNNTVGQRQLSADHSREVVDENDNEIIDTEGEGGTLRPDNISSRNNNEFASNDENDDTAEEEEADGDNNEAEEETRMLEATDPRLNENNVRSHRHLSGHQRREVVQEEGSNSVVAPSVAVALVNRNPLRAAIPHRPESSGARTAEPQRPGEVQPPIRSIHRKRKTRRERKKAAVQNDVEVIDLMDDSSDEDEVIFLKVKKPRAERVYFTINVRGRDDDPAFVELSTPTLTFQDLRAAISDQVEGIDPGFIFILPPLGRVSPYQESFPIIERFHEILNGEGRVKDPYRIVVKETNN